MVAKGSTVSVRYGQAPALPVCVSKLPVALNAQQQHRSEVRALSSVPDLIQLKSRARLPLGVFNRGGMLCRETTA